MEKLKQTFSNFYIDSSNKYVYEFLKNITDRKNDYSIVIISGKNGIGKTHLMVALEENIKDKEKVIRISSQYLKKKIIEQIKNENLDNLFNKIDILIIEDIQFLFSMERLEEEFYKLIRKFASENKMVLMTIDKEKNTIKNIGLIKRIMKIDKSKSVILNIKPKITNKTKMKIIKDFNSINHNNMTKNEITELAKKCNNFQELKNELNNKEILFNVNNVIQEKSWK